MSLDHLVSDKRKPDCDIGILQTLMMTRIQRILKEGDHDSADKELFVQVVLALRELASFRENFQKLKAFVEHADECPCVDEVKTRDGVVLHPARPCTCGLSALLKKLEAVG